MKFAVSLVATEATDAEGRPLVRGGELDLSPSQRDDPHNARLIAENQLIAIASPDKTREDARHTLENGPSVTEEGGADQ